MACNVSAFAPQTKTAATTQIDSRISFKNIHHHNSQHNILSALPTGGNEFYDLHQSIASMSHLLDATTATITSSSQVLSDAATAIVEEEAQSGGGWWESYLNIFKNALNLVHTTIDQPLRNVGWDQTWGISIFLFTICKCHLVFYIFVCLVDFVLLFE